MLKISESLLIPKNELKFHYVCSGGPGGQNVNKVATGVHLQFDFRKSTALPQSYKNGLEALSDARISKDGVITIKANRFRTQEMNRNDAMNRLAHLLRSAVISRKSRRPTRPTNASRKRKLEMKKRRGLIKNQRKKPTVSDF